MRSLVLVCVGILFLMFSATTTARADEVDERTRFAASFRYAGDAREEAGRKAAIDRAVDSLFFAIRGIARSRLSNGTKIDPTVSFAFAPGTIKARVPQSPEAISPDSGAAVDYLDANKERSKLSQRLVSGKLTQVFAADEGKRTNEWSLSPDGSTLSLRVTISSPKLSVPVTYVLTYKKI